MKPATARLAFTAAFVFSAAVSADDASTARHDRFDHYSIVTLRSQGGIENSGNSINDEGLVAGFVNVPSDDARHATLWLHGFPFDLGTLGGPNSNVAWPVKNTIGLVAGIAQTNEPEPLGQRWSCRSFFNPATAFGKICKGVVWEKGEITVLPTLGGYNGFATGANNHRQVVGWTENTIEDPTCVRTRQILQFKPVVWGPDLTRVRELPLVQGDSAGAATAINDKGQVVGISGDCGTAVGGVTARNAVLWEKGKVIKLGTLGGIAWNTPMAINERGDIVGFSNISAADGDVFNAQAFIWTRGRGIRPIRPLDGDVLSQALGINNRGQVVGISCTAGFASCRAFLWQDGVIVDLNERVARSPGSVPGTHPGVSDAFDDILFTANDINDRGEIAGQSFNPATQVFSAVWAIPVESHSGHDNDDAGAQRAARAYERPAVHAIGKRPSAHDMQGVSASARPQLPENVRQELLRSLGLSEARFVASRESMALAPATPQEQIAERSDTGR